MYGCAADVVLRDEHDLTHRMVADRVDAPIVIDGRLDEPVWATGPWYSLGVSLDRAADGEALRDGGRVRLAWDDGHLYLAADFTDRDLVGGRDEDQVHHYLFGDLCELFLKAQHSKHYWELYVTPRGRKTTLFLTESVKIDDAQSVSGLRVAARVNGTLDDPADEDRGWTAEMAVPVKDLTARGEPFGPNAPWRVFVGRYNHTVGSGPKGAELSMTPPLSVTSYHLTDQYAVLELRGR